MPRSTGERAPCCAMLGGAAARVSRTGQVIAVAREGGGHRLRPFCFGGGLGKDTGWLIAERRGSPCVQRSSDQSMEREGNN